VLFRSNVFVNCDKGIRALNASNVHAYQNTFVDSVASFERTPRSAVGDHFGWHPATGPAVEARHGHIFVGNLLVATEGFRKPLLNVEQSPQLCGKLTDAPFARIEGNAYVRRDGNAARPLITWSPADGPTCTAQVAAPSDISARHPGFEARSRVVNGFAGALFASPELRNLDLVSPLTVAVAEDPVPDPVRKAVGWASNPARTPGAYPLRPRTPPAVVR